jgi:hypothetical protein
VHSFLLYVVQVIKVFPLDVFSIPVVLNTQVLDVYVLVPKEKFKIRILMNQNLLVVLVVIFVYVRVLVVELISVVQ